MTIPADFAARMRAGRAYADLSREDLADKLGMSAGYVKNVENGKGLKATEQRALLELLPEITGLPRAFFAGEDERSVEKLDEILTVLQEIQASTQARYDTLDHLIRRQQDAERRIRHMTVEEADEMLRLLQESRNRLGRDVGRRTLPASGERGRRAAQ